MKASNITLRYTKQSTGAEVISVLDSDIPLKHHEEEARSLVQTGETRMAEVLIRGVGAISGARYFIDAAGAVVEEFFSEKTCPFAGVRN